MKKFFIYHLFAIIKAMKTATIIDLIVDSDVHTQSMNHIIKTTTYFTAHEATFTK